MIEPLVDPAALPTRTVRLSRRLSFECGVDFLIDGEGRRDGQPVRIGGIEVWDIVNETSDEQWFHLHGFSFQVIDVNGIPPASRSWQETVSVPGKGRVRIAWRVGDRPGRWACHCHVAEQHASGMVAQFDVVS